MIRFPLAGKNTRVCLQLSFFFDFLCLNYFFVNKTSKNEILTSVDSVFGLVSERILVGVGTFFNFIFGVSLSCSSEVDFSFSSGSESEK